MTLTRWPDIAALAALHNTQSLGGKNNGSRRSRAAGTRARQIRGRYPTQLQFRRRYSATQSRRRPRQKASLYRRARHARPTASLPTVSRVSALRCADSASARRTRAAGDARHHRLADCVPRLPQGRHRRGARQHAAHRGRLSFHAGRQPRQMPGGVGGAIPEIRKTDRAQPGPRARHRLRRQSARLPAVRGRYRRRRAGEITPRRPPATTWRSGSTPRVRPASRRAQCMCMPASSSPPISTARRSPA